MRFYTAVLQSKYAMHFHPLLWLLKNGTYVKTRLRWEVSKAAIHKCMYVCIHPSIHTYTHTDTHTYIGEKWYTSIWSRPYTTGSLPNDAIDWLLPSAYTAETPPTSAEENESVATVGMHCKHGRSFMKVNKLFKIKRFNHDRGSWIIVRQRPCIIKIYIWLSLIFIHCWWIFCNAEIEIDWFYMPRRSNV
jgi:hypothetical protein